jgi:CheY-like chemotaxis protein/HPt (histidine-containing phosphotransfer) domain-containing protein
VGQAVSAPGPVAERAAEMALRSAHRGARVLLVEDNRVNQLVAGELLRGVGLAVDLADDGLQAIDLVSNNDYALVLMDVQMPGLDGLQACRAIRRMPGKAQLPILAMTANAFSEDRAACLAAGMDDHIGKPVVPRHLYETLLHWLQRGRTATAAPAGADDHRPTIDSGDAALLAALTTMPGLDPTTALRYFAGRVPAYRRGLGHFVQAYAQGLPGSAMAPDGLLPLPPAALCSHLHSLQGAAATLGATALATQAQALEASLAAPAGMDETLARQRLQALQAGLVRLVAQICEALALTAPDPAGQPVTPDPR